MPEEVWRVWTNTGQIANLGAAKNGDRNNDHQVAGEHARLCVQSSGARLEGPDAKSS